MKYLTVPELSDELRIKPCTLYAWAAQGRIPSLKINGLIRFRRDDIDHWLESIRKQSQVNGAQPVTRKPFDLAAVIARVKRDTYNSLHGETRPRSSPIGKEAADGAV